jgi:hypothetical protein
LLIEDIENGMSWLMKMRLLVCVVVGLRVCWSFGGKERGRRSVCVGNLSLIVDQNKNKNTTHNKAFTRELLI